MWDQYPRVRLYDVHDLGQAFGGSFLFSSPMTILGKNKTLPINDSSGIVSVIVQIMALFVVRGGMHV